MPELVEEGKKPNNWHYRRLKCIIWIVTFRKGIIKFTLTKREELSAYRTSNDKPMQNRIIALYEDSMGNIRIDDNSEKTSRYKNRKNSSLLYQRNPAMPFKTLSKTLIVKSGEKLSSKSWIWLILKKNLLILI